MSVKQKRPGVFRVLPQLLATTDVARLFKRSTLTIYNWRQLEKMPYVVITGNGKDNIRFDVEEVTAWADSVGKEYSRVMAAKLRAKLSPVKK